MHNSFKLSLALLCAGLFFYSLNFAHAEPAKSSDSVDVPVKKVSLFSSGVGYFEHSGSVKETSTTELRFKTNQINDILKSLVLEDLDGGVVSSVVYPSKDPLSKILRSFQVDISSNPALGDLLNQLRGARVKVSYSAEVIDGTILGLEKQEKKVGDHEDRMEVWLLNILSGGTLRAIELEKVQKIELEDAQLQEELNKALLALSQARDQDKKPVTIHFEGKGERRVRLGYVVETPVWKTSYRLMMPAKVGEKGKLQGWAIIENQTDNDWNDIQLTLVSGRPVSFIQELYQPLYIPRPVVQAELYASLNPQTYQAGMGVAKDGDEEDIAVMPMARVPQRAKGKSMPAEQMYMQSAEAPSPAGYGGGMEKPMDFLSSVSSVASSGKVGELFQYTVGKVSLPRQRSAMIPIVNDETEVERVSIYNQNVLVKNPLNGAVLKNTTGKHLLQGPITVFDAGSYAGDATIDDLPPAQERLLSFAIDLKVLANPGSQKQENVLQTGKIVKGILQLSRKYITTQEYTFENKSDEDRVLIIEHPFRSGWKLVDSPTPTETTDTLYRFKETDAAGKTIKLVVKEEYIQMEMLAIFSANFGDLEVYSQSGQIPKKVQEVLGKAMDLRRSMVDTERQMQEKERLVNDITNEQSRIRENMKTVDSKSQYYGRLLEKLNNQETEIEKLKSEIESLRQTYDKQRKDLEDYLNNMTVE